ncbi:hypothetical protein [Parendozoicomonas haliclonae]|uniref:Uncharacterized protein n=1 Tax=Parendozoicomonas haliclonae TaxID=1960125 RepID=A0A1X7AGQ6_9GAMM|nr:hypothetical protein [Parendozoicomonas haliclonae]SMA33576.1 hypothetical protein EHSB41UT_00299 [Parendozoicomonas haliclonae]
MTLEEIKQAIEGGKRVFWKSQLYEVINDHFGGYLIVCMDNDSAIGLTWQDGKTMNGKEEDFFIA